MKILLNIMLLTSVIVLCGCEESHDPRVNMDDEVTSDSFVNNYITRPFGNAFSAIIGEGIEIERVVTTTNKSGLMEVHVQGYNRSVKTKRFEYFVEWMDRDGLVVETTTSTWLPVSAKRKSSFSFKSVAPNRNAVDFKINTRK